MTIDEDPSGATQIYNPDGASAGEWSVNISDDDTRTMAVHEVAFELSRGALDDDDTYVWREGMTDWVPLGRCAELQAELQRFGGGGAAAPPDADDDDDLAATMMVDTEAAMAQGDRAPAGQQVSRTMASPISDPYARPPEAVQPPAVDPGAAIPATGASAQDGSRRVGERNEASSLFSIDAIYGGGAQLGGAGKKKEQKEDVDDIFNLGAFGGGGIAAAFAPPPTHAPAPAPPAKPAAPAALAAPAAFTAARLDAPRKKSRVGMIVGLAIGGMLIAVAVVGFIMSQSEDKPTAQNDTASSAATGEEHTTPADTDQAVDSQQAGEEGATSSASDAAPEASGEAASDDKKAVSGGKSSSGGSAKATAKDHKKKDDKASSSTNKAKDDEKKDDKKKSKPAGEFNINAARSALGAAAGAASGCKKKGGPTGKGRATVTFAPSGRATQAIVGPPFAGTSVGSCAAASFRRASVPPFSGSPMTVSKSFYIR